MNCDPYKDNYNLSKGSHMFEILPKSFIKKRKN